MPFSIHLLFRRLKRLDWKIFDHLKQEYVICQPQSFWNEKKTIFKYNCGMPDFNALIQNPQRFNKPLQENNCKISG